MEKEAPYKSEAQRRFFHANKARLEAQGVDVGEWDRATKGQKLPERVKEATWLAFCDELEKISQAGSVASKITTKAPGLLSGLFKKFRGKPPSVAPATTKPTTVAASPARPAPDPKRFGGPARPRAGFRPPTGISEISGMPIPKQRPSASRVVPGVSTRPGEFGQQHSAPWS